MGCFLLGRDPKTVTDDFMSVFLHGPVAPPWPPPPHHIISQNMPSVKGVFRHKDRGATFQTCYWPGAQGL